MGAPNVSPSAAFVNIITGLEGIFGKTNVQKGRTEQSATSITEAELSGENRKRLELDPLAITRIIEETLSGPEGLASIFAGEQTAGIFDSTVAAQAAGNLTAKLIGELAKLTATEVATQEQTQKQVSTQESLQTTVQKSEDTGLLDQIFG